MPDWLVGLSSSQRNALVQAAGPIVPGFSQAGAQDRSGLKEALKASWISHNKLAQMLDRLQSIEVFAEPLLVAALKKRCNLALDVRQTCLRLYVPEGIAVAFKIRTLSLLEAALQNFEAKEARAGYFDEASRFISRPSANGQFEILSMGPALTVPIFVTLCRELDIGGQYQAYLKRFLLSDEPVASAVLQARVQTRDKDAFRAAVALAKIRGDISAAGQRMLCGLIDGNGDSGARGPSTYCHDLSLLDTPLTGIVLIGPDLQHSRRLEPVTVYIPHDPEQPLKQYSSTVAFLEALTAKLRSPRYQQFFSRFVPHAQRGIFFAALDAQLFRTQRQPASAHEPRPTRREPVRNPKLRMSCRRVKDDIWEHGFDQWRNQLIKEARFIAVPTGDEDLKSRWARWDSFMSVVATTLQMAACVAVSFVPVLGEAMLAYTVYQLLDETFEGIVAWSHGQRAEAAAHLLGVAENVALLGLFAAGGKALGAVRSANPSAFVENMRVVEARPGQPRLALLDAVPAEPPRLDERPLGTGRAPSLESRFKTLYPDASQQALDDFVGAFASEPMALDNLQTRERAFEALDKALKDWVAIERGDTLPIDQRYHKGKLASSLKRCWQAEVEASSQGYALDLDDHWSSDFLDDFPVLEVNFPHVNSLQWRNGALRTDLTRFLGYFPNLKTLDLSRNELAALPRLTENLLELQVLDVADNQLNLTAEQVADLKGLNRLEVLKLSNNPALTLPPDISLMPELNVLDLQNTGIADWPTGLRATPRPRSFELNLQDNPIDRIPEVTPGSEQARLIARTRLSRDSLPEPCLRQFQDYLRSVGYDPARSYPPKGEETSRYWLQGQAEALRTARQRTWDELERAPGAQGFFEVLEQLTETADYVEAAYRGQLTERVWRMLDAVSENPTLREDLFRMAINPDSCADAGAQLFNEMGVKVMIHEAYRSGDPAQVQARLLALAKGKSRLDQVNDIARATIQERLRAGETFIALDDDGEITGSIDEVEVYLAFQTGLAQALELPWQSRGMLFKEISGVDDTAIARAYQSVLALEAGDGLVNQIIGQRFWRQYLKKRYAAQFEENAATYRKKAEALLDKQVAGAITQQDYEREMIELAYARKALSRDLTRQAIGT